MENKVSKIIAIEHLTLDGVYQAPAREDEDTRNDYKHGGWSAAGDDPKMHEAIGEYMKGGWSLLAGRRTYEDLYASWPGQQPENAMTKALTDTQKFVVSRNEDYDLLWANSTLLAGEANEQVAQLKQQHNPTLIIFGSGELVRSLMKDKLIDELVLMIHPVISGDGLKLFNSETPFTGLKLINHITADTGVMIATYRLSGD